MNEPMPDYLKVSREQALWMFIAAALFGYFGYYLSWPIIATQTGQTIPLVATAMWTVRLSAIAFLISGLVTLAAPLFGVFLYGVTGLLSTAMLIVVGIWDLTSQYNSGIPLLLLVIFILINGYYSLIGVKDAVSVMAASGSETRETFGS